MEFFSHLSFLSGCPSREINVNIYQLALMVVTYQGDGTLGGILHSPLYISVLLDV